MDFAVMKRRELQALCKRHGLAAGGTNADLVARLTATLPGSGGAAAGEAVGVVVGKGCLKRAAGGGDSDAAKKVSFEVHEDEAGVSGRGHRRSSQVLSSPAVPKTRGRRPKAGEAPAPPAATKGNGGGRRRTRSQPAGGGDSADESDSGEEAGAGAPVRRPVTRKNSAKAEQQEVELGDAAAGRKRKTRENDDIEDVDVISEQVGVSRRSTRSSSSLLLEPDEALPSPVEKKRGRRKAADAKEKPRVGEQPTEPLLHSGRTLRSGVVVVAPAPNIVSESKKSKREVQEEEPAVGKVAEVEVSRRATRSGAVAAPLTSTSVITKKRGRKTDDDVRLDGGPDKKAENKRQSSRLTTHSSIHHPASTEEEATFEQVAAPSKGLPPRRSRRNPSEATVMLNSSNTTSESSRAPAEGNGAKDGVEELDQHVGLKKSKLRKGSATVATSGASATDMQIEVPGPVRRFTRKSVVPSLLEHETKGMQEDVEKKQTVTKPAGRSTRRSVAPVMLEKESKGLSKEIVPEDVEKKQTVTKPAGRSTRKSVAPVILKKESKGLTKEIVPEDVEKKQTVTKPVGRSTRRSVAPVLPGKESKGLTEETVPEAHVKRPTRKSVVPAMLEKGRKKIITEIIPEARVKRSTWKPTLPTVNSENNDHCDVIGTENIQSDTSEELEKQPTVKRLTRKSAVPAMPEKDRKGLPDMLNDENGDLTEMQSDKAGHLEKQLAVRVPVSKTASKSAVPDVIEEGNKGLHEDLKSEVSVRTPACKSLVPNAVSKENKDHSAFVRTEELSVKTRSAHTSLQVALQNDESLRRTTRRSSISISPPQSKPTASKGRPAKRRRTSSLQEDMPAEEQKEEQIAYGAHTNVVIEATTSTDLEIGVLPVAAEKSDLRESQVNSELEDMVVVDPGLSRDEDDTDNLDFELEGTVGTTEKPPSNLPIRDSKHVDALSEEAVHSIENDAGRCSANVEQSPTGPQFLFSQGIAERSATHNALPCPENSVDESDVHKVECQVEIAVSSKSDSYQGSDENSARVEESGDCTFSSQQNNEQEGFPVSSCPKDLTVSAQLYPPDDADYVVRGVYTKDLMYKEEEKKDCIPSSDINVPHDTSPASEPAENPSGVSGAAFCTSQSTPISDEVNSDSSRSESPDALDNLIASSNAEAVQQDNNERDLHIEVTHGIHASGISEAAQVEVPESGKVPLPDVETSPFRDAQLNRKQEGNEFEEHSFSCSKDECGKNNTSQPANECVMDSCQEQELKLSHDLSAVKSPKGSTICQDEFVIGSVIGQTSGSIVEGNNIAMDASGTGKQGDNLNSSATALHMNKENAPSYKTDGPEVSSDHLFLMDSSAGPVQSVSGRLREAGLAVGNSDNKLNMEQVQQDDVQGLEGTLEKAALGSVTPEGKHVRGLPDEAEQHSLKEIRSSSVEQSSFGLQSLLSQDDTQVQEGTLEKAALGSVTPEGKHESGLPDEVEPHSSKNERCSSVERSPFGQDPLFLQERIEEPSEKVALAVHAKNGVDESKDVHVEHVVEKPSVRKSVSDHDRSVDFSAVSKSEDCAYTSDEVNEYEGLTKSCHEQEQVACQLDLLEAANCVKDFIDPEEVSYDEENKKPVHSTYISSSCEEIDANVPVKHASGLGDGLLSSSLIASTECTDVHSRSSPNKFESTDFRDEPKGCSSTEALQQGLDEAKENKVTLLSSSPIASTDDTYVHPSSNRNQFESTDFLDELKGCSSSEALQQGLKEHSDEPNEIKVTLLSSSLIVSSDVTDGHLTSNPNQFESTDFLDKPKGCSSTEALQQGLEEQCDEPKENKVTLLSSSLIASTDVTDVHLSSNPDQFESTDFLDEQKGCSGTEALQQCLKEQSNEPKENQVTLLSSSLTASTDDTDVHPSSNPDQFESTDFLDERKGCSSSDALQQGLKGQCDEPKENQDTYEAGPSDRIEADTAKDLKTEVPPLPAEEASNMVECSFPQESSKRFDMPDDLVLPSSENEDDLNTCHVEKMFSSEPDSSKGSDIRADLLLPSAEDKDDSIAFHVEHEKKGQLIASLLDAETSALPDEQANPEPEAGRFEKCNFSSNDTGGKIATGYVKTNLFQLHEDYPTQEKKFPDDLSAPQSPEQSTIGHNSETSVWPDEQPNPELEAGEFEERNLTNEDYPTQERKFPDDLSAPQSPEQSTIGHNSETSVWPDEQHNPELEAGEFEERNLTNEDYPIQGKKLLDDLPAPKSPEQSIAGQDAGTSARLGEQPNPELHVGEFEERIFSSKDSSVGTGYDEDNLFQLLDGKFDLELEVEEHNDSCDKSHSFIFPSGSVKKNTCHWDDKEEYNEHNDDQVTAAMLSSGMTEPTLIQRSESGMALLSAAGTPALTDEQLNSKLEDDEQNLCFDTDTSNFSDPGLMENSSLFSLPKDTRTEACYEHELPIGTPAARTPALTVEQLNSLEDDEEQNLCFDTETGNFCDTGLMKNRNLFSLPEDTRTESCYEHELPIGTPAAKSAGESAVCQDGSVPGSVGTCQTSISTKLQRFKISSTVKASYIAVGTKPWENPRPISLLGNSENVPAAANPDDPAELNTDCSDVKDSSRQGTTDGL